MHSQRIPWEWHSLVSSWYTHTGHGMPGSSHLFRLTRFKLWVSNCSQQNELIGVWAILTVNSFSPWNWRYSRLLQVMQGSVGCVIWLLLLGLLVHFILKLKQACYEVNARDRHIKYSHILLLNGTCRCKVYLLRFHLLWQKFKTYEKTCSNKKSSSTETSDYIKKYRI